MNDLIINEYITKFDTYLNMIDDSDDSDISEALGPIENVENELKQKHIDSGPTIKKIKEIVSGVIKPYTIAQTT